METPRLSARPAAPRFRDLALARAVQAIEAGGALAPVLGRN